VRIVSNHITGVVHQIGGTTYSAVDAILVNGHGDIIVLGNQVASSEGNGISLDKGFEHAIIVANSCAGCGSQSSHSAGSSAIYVQTNSSQSNRGLVVQGNNCWSSSTSVTPNAIQIQGPTPQVQNANILANNAFGNVTTGILADASVDNDTVSMFANSAWPDRMHTPGSYTNSTTTLTATPNVPSIPGGSMRSNGGIRITAGGRTTGKAGNRKMSMGFGSLGYNIFGTADATWKPTSASGSWTLTATITNTGSTSSQAAVVNLYADGNDLYSAEVNLNVTTGTTASVPLTLNTQNVAAGDSISVDFVVVERC
jgi:hypothetical protein